MLDHLIVECVDDGGNTTLYNSAHLPEHIRCASHLLNLLASADFDKVLLTNRIFQEKYNRAIGKLTKLWNRYNRSTLASDKVHSIFGKSYLKCFELTYLTHFLLHLRLSDKNTL